MASSSPEESNLFAASSDESKARQDPPLRVSDVCNEIKRALGSVRDGRPFRVAGEIGDFRAQRGSGHWYFTLKDANGGAVLNCAYFAQRQRQSGASGPPSEGAAVVVKGKLDYYPPFGKLSFIVDELREDGTGDLHEQFLRLRVELENAGYFDPAIKIRKPAFCRRIAILTSPDGAVRHDIERTARGRWPGIELRLVPIPVQGEHAAPVIARAIRAVRQAAPCLGIDAIILARGGGSLEDLWAFNERVIAEAIHESRQDAIDRGCPVPLVSAIGHESDVTISDLVSDERASTPTHAADILVPAASEEKRYLSTISSRLASIQQSHARRARARLDACLRHPSMRRPHLMLEPHARRLADALDDLQREMAQCLANRRLEAGTLAHRLGAASPLARHAVARTNLKASMRRLERAVGVRLSTAAARLGAQQRNLEAVGPSQVLSRGYSITLDEKGRVMRSAGEAEVGTELETRLQDGSVRSRVLETTEGSDTPSSE
ncbi:MAG: exodeoxyribonuclease VII large subunit [Phycisphaerales bacterium]|nr:exodeoxyribonuclease VII large subunit [Phycisphaerales bacterium]